MNIYKEMLEKLYEVKGREIKSFTKIKDLERLLNTLSICEEIKSKYNIDLTDRDMFNEFNVSTVDSFSAQVSMNGGDGYIRLISEIYNSDKQPIGSEMLFKIAHPTGAYIFGEYYPRDLFNEFFEELKNRTNFEYLDDVNHSLYYKIENMLESLGIYNKIYKEYSEKNKENYKKEMIKRKKEEIERLESEIK